MKDRTASGSVVNRRYFQHAHFMSLVGVGKYRHILIGPR